MTLDAQIKEFQDHARHSLQSGQPGPALALLTQANELQPDQPSTLMLQAISLSRLNQPAAANDAFRQALTITPDDAKLRFNFAVHLYSYGNRQEALDQVDLALSVNPDHAGSVDLAAKIERDLGLPPRTTRKTVPSQIAYQFRGGYEPGIVHTIPLLGKISTLWTVIGWALALGSVVVTILLVAVIGQGVSGNGTITDALATRHLSGVFKGTYISIMLLTIFFGVSDLLDRRGNWAWLIPLVVLPALCLGWIGLPLYLVSERKA